MEKECSKCTRVLSEENFSKDSRVPSGLQSQCKECVAKKKTEQYRALHGEKKLAFNHRSWELRRKRKLEKRQCMVCSEPATEGKQRCALHARQANTEEVLRRKRLKEQGLCYKCGVNPISTLNSAVYRRNPSYCETCRMKVRKTQLEYQREYMNKLHADRIRQGVCVRCGLRPAERRPDGTFRRKSHHCLECLAKIRKHNSERTNIAVLPREHINKVQRQITVRCKQEVFQHYGNSCACCGETGFLFLSMDHVENDGAEHRRKIWGSPVRGCGYAMYSWLRRNNYPAGFQILCGTCQQGKKMNGGVCPHVSDPAGHPLPVRNFGE